MNRRDILKFVASLGVICVVLQTAAAVPQVPSDRVTIEGIVTSEGTRQPIAGARVMILRFAVNGEGNLVRVEVVPRPARGTPTTPPAVPPPQLTVTTADDGKFAFTNLDPGTYRVLATANGYVGQGNGQLLDLTSRPSMKNAAIHMTPSGVVRGRILDDAGQPAFGVPIQVMQYSYNATGVKTLRQMATGRTDDRGEYRISELKPGQYRLAAGNGAGPLPSGRQAPSVLYALSYFPGVNDIAQAASIEIKSGSETLADMSARRLQLRKVRGSVVDLTGQATTTPGAGGPSGVRISMSFPYDTTNCFDNCGSFEPPIRSYDPVTGKFEIQNVIPGEYTIRASMPDTKTPPTEADLFLFRSLGSNEVSIVVRDSDVENVRLTFTTATSIPGKVTIEGLRLETFSFEGLRFQYRKSTNWVPEGTVITLQATIGADGTFRVDGMRAGEYLATVVGIPTTHYLKSLRFDGKDVLGSPLEFPGSGAIEIVLGSGAGQVAGIVTDSTMKPIAGVQAVLIPESKRNRSDLYKAKVTDQNGHFTIFGVAPGDYKIFAWDGMEPFRYFDPDFIKLYEAKGKSIRVGESTMVTADIQVITVPQQ